MSRRGNGLRCSATRRDRFWRTSRRTTARGWRLQTTAWPVPSTGTVVDKAERCGFVEVGDRVAFGKYNGRLAAEWVAQRMGFGPKQLCFLRAVFVQRPGEEPQKHVGQDEIFGVIEEG